MLDTFLSQTPFTAEEIILRQMLLNSSGLSRVAVFATLRMSRFLRENMHFNVRFFAFTMPTLQLRRRVCVCVFV